jgi:hypothetical protein
LFGLTGSFSTLVDAFIEVGSARARGSVHFLIWNLAFAGMMLITAQDALGAELFRA